MIGVFQKTRLLLCRILTQFRAKMPTTLSQGVPSFGCQFNRFESALARSSDLWKNSETEYVFPVRPQVKGLRLWDGGHRPYTFSLMNCAIVIESGGSFSWSVPYRACIGGVMFQSRT